MLMRRAEIWRSRWGAWGPSPKTVEVDEAVQVGDGLDEVGDALDGVEAADEADGDGAGVEECFAGGSAREVGKSAGSMAFDTIASFLGGTWERSMAARATDCEGRR
jgi:hypothetical protein